MEQISKVITVEEHFMSEKVNGEYQKLLEKKNLTLAQKAKANFIQQFVAKGEITEVGGEVGMGSAADLAAVVAAGRVLGLFLLLQNHRLSCH